MQGPGTDGEWDQPAPRVASGPSGPQRRGGWRHQLLAVVGACVLLGALWLTPDLTPSPDQSFSIQTVQGRIRALSGAAVDLSQPNAEVLLLDGQTRGGSCRPSSRVRPVRSTFPRTRWATT